MNVREAANRIGISASKLYQLVTRRAVAHYRIGGRIVFRDADIDAYLASCRVGAVAPAATTAPTVPPRLKHLSLPRRAGSRPPPAIAP